MFDKSLDYIKKQVPAIKRVIFVPGWQTDGKSQKDQTDFLKTIYVQAEIETRFWDSLRPWMIAKTNAEKEGKEIATEWRKSGESFESTVFVGHSLGGRVVAHALAEMGRQPLMDHAVLLGAAIDNDHSCVDLLGRSDSASNIGGTIGPVLNCSNENDGVLRYVYGNREWSKQALGLMGPAKPHVGLIDSHLSANGKIFADGKISMRSFAPGDIPREEMKMLSIDELDRAIEIIQRAGGIDQAVKRSAIKDSSERQEKAEGYISDALQSIYTYWRLDEHESLVYLELLRKTLQ